MLYHNWNTYVEIHKTNFNIIKTYCSMDLDYYTLPWMTLYGATKANRAKATGGHVHYNA